MALRAAQLTLPSNVRFVRRTPTFTASSVPGGLRKAHRVAEGAWGRLMVEEGSVRFTFEDEPPEIRNIVKGEFQVIPPQRLHHVTPAEDAKFLVEFYRPEAQ